MKTLWSLTAVAIIALSSMEGSTNQMNSGNLERQHKEDGVTLHVYGPGGPLEPMRECAKMFSDKTGINVRLTAGVPPQWIEQAKQDGDLIYEGAEYMLNDFMRMYPAMVDESSITGLYSRAAAILVRKDNPHNVRKLGDLTKHGVKVMVVTQENMEEVHKHVPGIQYNIVMPVLTGAQAAQAWKNTPELDAWITYESWRSALKDDTGLVEIQGDERVLRITPIAILQTSKYRKNADEFVNFLKGNEAHKVFQKWGWK